MLTLLHDCIEYSEVTRIFSLLIIILANRELLFIRASDFPYITTT